MQAHAFKLILKFRVKRGNNIENISLGPQIVILITIKN